MGVGRKFPAAPVFGEPVFLFDVALVAAQDNCKLFALFRSHDERFFTLAPRAVFDIPQAQLPFRVPSAGKRRRPIAQDDREAVTSGHGHEFLHED